MPENYQIIMQELVRRSNEETRRLRTIEQRLDALEDKLNVMLETTAEKNKKTSTKFADTDVAMKNISTDIINIKLGLDKINKQLAKFAQRRDLKEIEYMLDLLGPAFEKEKKELVGEISDR